MSYIEVDVNGKALFNHERYRISVLRCCEEWCSPVKKIERRTREYYSLHFIIGGKGTLVYEVNGQRQEVVLQKGDSFLLFAGRSTNTIPIRNGRGDMTGSTLRATTRMICFSRVDMKKKARLFIAVILIDFAHCSVI